MKKTCKKCGKEICKKCGGCDCNSCKCEGKE
jgi:hypothetical protein